MTHEFSLDYARQLDSQDTLRHFRKQFYIPRFQEKEAIYFLGNSLGLQPTTTQDEVLNIMEDWANFGVEGFFMGRNPWLEYPKKNNAPALRNYRGKATRAGYHEPSHC